jgi:hypothetical protein
MDLEAIEEDLPAPTILSYSTDVPVKIYRISARICGQDNCRGNASVLKQPHTVVPLNMVVVPRTA